MGNKSVGINPVEIRGPSLRHVYKRRKQAKFVRNNETDCTMLI